MIEFLKMVDRVFEALKADGAEDPQLVIAPHNAGLALTLKWKARVGDRWYASTHVLDLEILDVSYGPDLIEQSVMAEVLAGLQKAIIDGKTREKQSDGS